MKNKKPKQIINAKPATKNTKKDLKQSKIKIKNDIATPKELKKRSKIFWIKWAIFGGVILLIGLILIILVVTGNSGLIQTIFGDILINNFLAVPALLIATITIVGNFLQKIVWYQALASGLKAFAGFVILQIGALVLTGVAGPIMRTFGKVLDINSYYLNPYLGWTNTQKVLNVVADATYIISYIVIIGLAINIALVALRKWTNCNSINVTGHVMFQQASVLAIIFYFIIFRNMAGSARIDLSFIFGGIVIGFYWAVFTNLAINPVQKVTNNAGFTLGHQQMLGVWCAYNAGKLLHRNKKEKPVSIDKIKLSKGWDIFQDNIVTSSILIFIFFEALLLGIYIANPGAFKEIFTGANGLIAFNIFNGKAYLLMALLIPFELVVAIQIIMSGARMFVGELQKSFIGISKKLIPGALVAIDVAATFAFAKNSIIVGFLSGAVGNFVAMTIIIALVATKAIGLSSIILVGFVPMFFDNAAIGIFADKTGGWKACITMSFISGFLIVFGALLMTQLGGEYTYKGTTQSVWSFNGAGGYMGMWDADILWSLVAGLSTLMGVNGAPYVILLIVGLFILIAQLTNTNINQPNQDNSKTNLRIYIENKFDLIFKNNKKKLNSVGKQKLTLVRNYSIINKIW